MAEPLPSRPATSARPHPDLFLYGLSAAFAGVTALTSTLAPHRDAPIRRRDRVPWSPRAWSQVLYLTGAIPVLAVVPLLLVVAGLPVRPRWALPFLVAWALSPAIALVRVRDLGLATSGCVAPHGGVSEVL